MTRSFFQSCAKQSEVNKMDSQRERAKEMERDRGERQRQREREREDQKSARQSKWQRCYIDRNFKLNAFRPHQRVLTSKVLQKVARGCFLRGQLHAKSKYNHLHIGCCLDCVSSDVLHMAVPSVALHRFVR